MIAALILAAVGGFYPNQTSVVPSWKLLVVDEQTRPYAAVTVTQAWAR
jgi:hypothetical protein